MEIGFSQKGFVLDKVLNSLDCFVLDFVRVLDRLDIKYVIVSGYVAILFGRSRASEDVDLIMEKIGNMAYLRGE